MCRNDRAQNQFNVFFATVDVNRLLFPLLLGSPLSRALDARNIGRLLSAKLSIICSAVFVYQSKFRTISLLIQVPRMTNDREEFCEQIDQQIEPPTCKNTR